MKLKKLKQRKQITRALAIVSAWLTSDEKLLEESKEKSDKISTNILE